MFELQPAQFPEIIPLLSDIKQAVVPLAVCEGVNPGRPFVDHPQNPTLALIWTGVGYYFLAGSPASQPDLAPISERLLNTFIPASREMGETGYILITSPGWDEHLASLLPGRALIQIFRRTFTLDQAVFFELAGRPVNLPPDFTLIRMDEALAEAAGLPPTWRSPKEFVQHGIGFAVLHGDSIVSSCSSIFASSRGVEIDVSTAEEYRGRGFATLTAAALIQECLRQGRLPNWECFWENETSTRLAQKMGFQIKEDYPVTYWEEG